MRWARIVLTERHTDNAYILEHIIIQIHETVIKMITPVTMSWSCENHNFLFILSCVKSNKSDKSIYATDLESSLETEAEIYLCLLVLHESR